MTDDNVIPMPEPIPPDEVLPCGCILRCSIEDDVRTLTMIPCNDMCPNYRNALGLAYDGDVPVEYRMGP